MRFWASLAYTPIRYHRPMAEALDGAGYTGVLLADHLVTVREVSTPYPYSADGSPPWTGGVEFPDVWVSMAAMAAATTSLRFGSSVYVAPARDVFGVAKQVGTLAALSDGRVTLGLGVGWMREEFALTGQSFTDRGRRLDEMIDVMRLLWTGDWVEHHGTFYDFPALQMLPAPARAVPLWCGGYSDRALRRAATRCDGWIGVFTDVDQAKGVITTLRGERETAGRDPAAFDVVATVPDPPTERAVEEWGRRGVTDMIVRPWSTGTDPVRAPIGSARGPGLQEAIDAASAFGLTASTKRE